MDTIIGEAMDEKPDVEEVFQPEEVITTSPPKLKNYQVRVGGGFIINIRGKSKDHAEGLAVGNLANQLPKFIVSSVLVDEVPDE